MLVLTQAGIGLCGGAFQAPSQVIILGTLLFNVGMVAATFHLGQPLKAWRFFLGLRTSWLSREILAFSLFAPIPIILAALPFLSDFPFKEPILQFTKLSVIPLGMIAIFTSIMIYHDTRRSLWRLPMTSIRFFGGTLSFLLLGLAIAYPILRPLAALSIIAQTMPELRTLRLGLSDGKWTPDRHSARLLFGPLEKVTIARFALAGLATVTAVLSPILAIPLLLASHILERQLFFQAVHAPKMPGNFGPGHNH